MNDGGGPPFGVLPGRGPSFGVEFIVTRRAFRSARRDQATNVTLAKLDVVLERGDVAI
jgi:hypothetical protein